MIRRLLYLSLVFVLLTSFPGQANAATSETTSEAATTLRINEGELAIKFKGGIPSEATRASFASAARLEETGTMDAIGWVTYHITDGADTLKKVQALRSSPEVLAAVPDILGEFAAFPQTPPSDPKYSSQWGHARINMLGAWQIAGGGATNKILAVMDTGVQGGMDANGNWTTQHPDLGYVDGRNFTLPYVNGQPQRKLFHDQCGHGTAVAGVAAAFTNNGTGIAGVAYNAPIWSFRITPSGSCSASMLAAAKAVNWAVANDVYAITASFVHEAPDSAVLPFKAAVDNAYANGVMVVAASGNGDISGFGAFIPARWTSALTVGGTNAADGRCRWKNSPNEWEGANYGTPGLDVSAPCLSVWTTTLGGGYASVHGTSIAVPYVAGIVFLIKSRHPSWVGSQIKSRIWSTADKVGGYSYSWNSFCGGQSSQLGCGLIDADAAVQ